MQRLARTTLVALLISALTCLPLLAVPAKSLGTVIQAEAALLDNSAAAIGANVYPGDLLQTEPGGTLRLRMGTMQIYLLSGSAASLAESSSGISATLTRGTAGFCSPGPGVVEVQTPQATIRTRGSAPAHGQVIITGPDELVISSNRGALDVDVDGEIHTVSEGHAYRMVLEPEPQGPEGAGTKRSGTIAIRKSKKPLFYTLTLGAGAVAGYFIYRELMETESPSGMDKD